MIKELPHRAAGMAVQHRAASGSVRFEGSGLASFEISIQDTGEAFRCPDSKTVLEGMQALNRAGIPVGCRGGGCGVCKIAVVSGTYSKRAMSREHVSEADEEKHSVLACRIRPTSDIAVRVLEKMKRFACSRLPMAELTE